jgi:hypothetical protein
MLHDRRIPLYVGAGVLAGFLIGFVWQYTQANRYRGELETTSQELTFQQLEATLGAAAIEAQRGSHEIARQLASQFFTGLQQNIGRAPAERRAQLDDILGRRDVMITALSRGDPQAGPMLAQIFFRFRSAFGRPVGPDATTLPAPGADPRDTADQPRT